MRINSPVMQLPIPPTCVQQGNLVPFLGVFVAIPVHTHDTAHHIAVFGKCLSTTCRRPALQEDLAVGSCSAGVTGTARRVCGTMHLPSAVKPPPRPPCSVTELYTVMGTFSILLSTCISTFLCSDTHAQSTWSARHQWFASLTGQQPTCNAQ
jgi:hypothetical protein